MKVAQYTFGVSACLAVVCCAVLLAAQDSAPPKQDTSKPRTPRVRVSQQVAEAFVLKKVPPQYPDDAHDQRIQGTVLLRTDIGADGNVENVALISGHPLLAPAAIEAVKQWKYKPYLLNGQPAAVETQVQIKFTLSPP